MFVFSALGVGVRLALNQRIRTPVPLSRKPLCLSSLRNMVSYVQFLFKFSLYRILYSDALVISYPELGYSSHSAFFSKYASPLPREGSGVGVQKNRG